MKNCWTDRYIDRQCRERRIRWHEWRRQKAAELEAKTGLAWTDFHTRNIVQFWPRWHPVPAIDPAAEPELAARILALPAGKGYPHTVDFIAAAERLAVPIATAIGICKGLARGPRPRIMIALGRAADSAVGFYLPADPTTFL